MLRILVIIGFCLLPRIVFAGDEPEAIGECEGKNLSAVELAARPLVSLADFRAARSRQASRAAAATPEALASAPVPNRPSGPSELVNASFAAAHLGFRRDFSIGPIFFDLGIRLPGAPIPESQMDLGFGEFENFEGLVDSVSEPALSPQVISSLAAAPQGDLFAATLTSAISSTGGRHYADSVVLFRLRREGGAVFEFMASPRPGEGRFGNPAFVGPSGSLLRVALETTPEPQVDSAPARVVFPKNIDILLYPFTQGAGRDLPAPHRLSSLFRVPIERVDILAANLYLVKLVGGDRPVIVPVDLATQNFGSPLGLPVDTELARHGATVGAVVESREGGARMILRTGTVVTIRYGASVIEEVRPQVLSDSRALILSTGTARNFLEVVGERVSYIRGEERAVIRDLGYNVSDMIRVNGGVNFVAVREGNKMRIFELTDFTAEPVGEWSLSDSDLPLHRLNRVEGGFFAPRDEFRNHGIFLGANGRVERLSNPEGGMLLDSFNRNFYFRLRVPRGVHFPLELRFFGESNHW